ncbi:MAG: hypothetical protein HQ553_00540 [Chloroflexi bacterium]|nr:hypothetical protein [Chloroflexota bacterium]
MPQTKLKTDFTSIPLDISNLSTRKNYRAFIEHRFHDSMEEDGDQVKTVFNPP